jgi:hypothetical protein
VPTLLQPPIPADFRMTFFGIERVTRLPDGRVRAIARLTVGDEAPRLTAIMLRDEEGRYRIEFGRDTGIGVDVAPEP